MANHQKNLDVFHALVPIEAFDKQYSEDIAEEYFFGFALAPLVEAEENLLSPKKKSVAYFSMEYGLSSNI